VGASPVAVDSPLELLISEPDDPEVISDPLDVNVGGPDTEPLVESRLELLISEPVEVGLLPVMVKPVAALAPDDPLLVVAGLVLSDPLDVAVGGPDTPDPLDDPPVACSLDPLLEAKLVFADPLDVRLAAEAALDDPVAACSLDPLDVRLAPVGIPPDDPVAA